MSLGKYNFYWDACVFISLFGGQNRTDEEMDTLRQLQTLVEIEAITVFTSAITKIEVLEFVSPDEEAAFIAFLQRCEMVSVTGRIVDLGREIRNHYRQQGSALLVPDAIHLATSIHYDATALHTYDGCGRRPKKADLLNLTVPIIGKYNVKVCKPDIPDAFKPKEVEVIIPQAAEKPGNLFDFLEEMNGQSESEDEPETSHEPEKSDSPEEQLKRVEATFNINSDPTSSA